MAIFEEVKNSTAVRMYRQGWLAWLGAHKAVYDLAQDGVDKLVNDRKQLVEGLVEKGESVEELARENLEKVRGFVEPNLSSVSSVSDTISTVAGKVFNRGQDQTADAVAELSAELAKLTKTVTGLSRKVNAAKKPAAKKAPAKKAVATSEKKETGEAKAAA